MIRRGAPPKGKTASADDFDFTNTELVLPDPPEHISWDSSNYRVALTFVFQDGIAQGGKQKFGSDKYTILDPVASWNKFDFDAKVLYFNSVAPIISASSVFGFHGPNFSPADLSVSPPTVYDLAPNNGRMLLSSSSSKRPARLQALRAST